MYNCNDRTIKELEKNVWQYQSDVETHTVETHIYRLRKKIFQTFKDQSFIISKKKGLYVKICGYKSTKSKKNNN